MVEPATDSPYISIIIPVKNEKKTIQDLLDSLMKINYPREKMEILLVDGYSTDGTRKIIRDYPVEMIDQIGRGLNAARNTGARKAKGEIIVFTDGDCVVSPNWLKAIEKDFQDPDTNFVGGSVRGYDNIDPISVYLEETFFQVTPKFRGRIETTDLDLHNFPAGANMAFRREALEKIDYFDERITYGFDDLEPLERLGAIGYKMVLDPEVLVWHKHRTDIKEMLEQHFNYGRGGSLISLHKKNSKLAKWFSRYLLYTLSGIIFLLGMCIFSIQIENMLPAQIAIGLLLLGVMAMTIYYIPLAIRSGKILKLFYYPILDLARGFAFTFGGLTQLLQIVWERIK
jgi:GT2 family glycosyltransferase